MLWHSGDKEAGEDVKQTRDEGMGCENSLCLCVLLHGGDHKVYR